LTVESEDALEGVGPIPFFAALAGCQEPFPWQAELYALLLAGRWPSRIDLPTGTGKTSILHLWLLALAEQARLDTRSITVPRRLVWVVDRRVVVDQATDEAERALRRVLEAPDLAPVRQALASLSGDADNPLTISTLRGWRRCLRREGRAASLRQAQSETCREAGAEKCRRGGPVRAQTRPRRGAGRSEGGSTEQERGQTWSRRRKTAALAVQALLPSTRRDGQDGNPG
jgi:hypothetical protein